LRATREETPSFRYTSEAPSNARLALTLDAEKVLDPARGLTFGTDSDRCDVVLDVDNRRGISGIHFCLNFNHASPEPNILVLENFSINGTRMLSALTNDRAIILDNGDQKSHILAHDGPTWVDVAEVSLLFRVPRMPRSSEFWLRWRKYCQELKGAPRFALDLDGEGKATERFPDLRSSFPKPARFTLHKNIVFGSGVFGTVFEVRETSTGNKFAGKAFKKPAFAVLELEMMKRLQHVRTW
jgi:hypothetical protein